VAFRSRPDTLISDFRSVLERSLIVAQTFWGGIKQFVFDLNEDLIFSAFGKVYGWLPVNWIGNGFRLLASHDGLCDVYGNLVVKFDIDMWKVVSEGQRSTYGI